jgi:hypothetical protein
MPRKAFSHSLVATFHRQVASTVAALRQEITSREKELGDLKAERARWQKVMNGRIITSQLQITKRPRVDWGALLRELPARFTTQDVAAKTGKPLPHVYAGIWRWTKDRKIARDRTGYRKLSTARS